MLFETREQLIQVMKTFKADEGIIQNVDKLQSYLQAQFRLWQETNRPKGGRTSTYLNFPGTTEKAFLFYRSVFRTEFAGQGIQRLGDIPTLAGHPPVAEADKKLILHIELPILGNHYLMGKDAPESMGFQLVAGNNMHINLEPETREEIKRLFEALSEGGKITMPLQDMFWGAYYGSCTDRFGINWMLHCLSK